jgi:hypothetical protein
MLPGVNVIFLRIYQKCILIAYKQKERKKIYWEGSCKIYKFKKQFSARAHVPNVVQSVLIF